MARINDLKANIDIDSRDLRIKILEAKNNLLELQLEEMQHKQETKTIDIFKNKQTSENFYKDIIAVFKNSWGTNPEVIEAMPMLNNKLVVTITAPYND